MKTRDLLTFILLAWLLVSLSACQKVPLPQDAKAGRHLPDGSASRKTSTEPNEIYGLPTRVGVLEDRAVDESSGIVASRMTPGMYWTHNDSGDGPFIYALDDLGHSRGVWRITGAVAYDWEDIAAGPGPIAGKCTDYFRWNDYRWRHFTRWAASGSLRLCSGIRNCSA